MVQAYHQARMAVLAVLAMGLILVACGSSQTTRPSAEVIHWWTSGGESSAVKQIEQAYRAAGGEWVDMAIAGGDQARAVTINRIVGGNPPTAAQFNISMQFSDMIEADQLNNVDALAFKQGWDKVLPETINNLIKVKGHYYALPLGIHMQTWIWYSRAAFRKAGIAKEPVTVDELFGALDKLKAAGMVPLAHGGQAWQEAILFAAMLSNIGGKPLYLSVIRDRDQRAIQSDTFRKVLLAYKRLRSYVDAGSPGRNWNDASAMLIAGKAGVQIMGDWAKGEFSNAGWLPGQQYGCIPGLGPDAPYLIQGDVFVFPKTRNPNALKAQELLARVALAPATQLAFNKMKGSIPPRADIDVSTLDLCAQQGAAILKDKTRLVGIAEVYLTPDQNGALQDVLTSYWNTDMPVESAQKKIAAALRD